VQDFLSSSLSNDFKVLPSNKKPTILLNTFNYSNIFFNELIIVRTTTKIYLTLKDSSNTYICSSLSFSSYCLFLKLRHFDVSGGSILISNARFFLQKSYSIQSLHLSSFLYFSKYKIIPYTYLKKLRSIFYTYFLGSILIFNCPLYPATNTAPVTSTLYANTSMNILLI